MSDSGTRFELPRKIEHILAALSNLYKNQKEKEKLAIIVNAQVRIVEGVDHDNWNGDIIGHDVILTIPEDLFVKIVDYRSSIQNKICGDLNKFRSCEDEYFSHVIFELEQPSERDWRLDSGVLEAPKRTILPKASQRIWGDFGFKVFLSRVTAVKKETAVLKDKLRLFGIAAFVAHEDIMPTKEWQNEIETALEPMDGFVALLTEGFHESLWTDQEVGYAFARSIPMISVSLGRNPYGFIGKFQGLPCSWENAPTEIAKLFLKNPRMVDAYIKALPKCRSFAEGLELSKLLPEIETLTVNQADEMVIAYNANDELNGCFGFHGQHRPDLFGKGLAFHLSRASGIDFRNSDNRTIQTR